MTGWWDRVVLGRAPTPEKTDGEAERRASPVETATAAPSADGPVDRDADRPPLQAWLARLGPNEKRLVGAGVVLAVLLVAVVVAVGGSGLSDSSTCTDWDAASYDEQRKYVDDVLGDAGVESDVGAATDLVEGFCNTATSGELGDLRDELPRIVRGY